MRPVLALVVLLGCASDDLEAPDDCAINELHVVHGSSDERVTLTSYAFVNKLGDDNGSLDIGVGGADHVRVEFTKLVPDGATVDARGSIQLASGLDVGNCETGGLPSKLEVYDGFWRFELRDVAMAPYCSGAAVAESVSGCFRAR